MYRITANDDETITIDAWSIRLEAARQLRPDAWVELIQAWRAEGGAVDFDLEPVRSLFCALRIDGARARRMLEDRGDISAAPIDCAPEKALEGENQLIEDEIINEDRIFIALAERLGMQQVDFTYGPDLDAFLEMRKTLTLEGEMLPGMRGL